MQTIFDIELIRRYDKAGPRYTSYPTAVQFHEGFQELDYHHQAQLSNAQPLKPLSLYVHIPFCDTVCFYCACNKIATKDHRLAATYLSYLQQEIALHSRLFNPERVVTQLHWGGGTPTFLTHAEMQTLMQQLRQHFQLLTDDSGEYSIEIDPREASIETIALLRELGFNRMSLGVQDFNPHVQKAVNRLQSEAQTFEILNAARQHGFKSISIDLIYGLPKQTVTDFAVTLAKIVAVKPERISVFNYAHLPTLFKPQRRINEAELPSAQEKLAILQQTIDYLTTQGYVYIGMDHFALPEDELAIAQRNHSLYRNFQGYSTQAYCDLIGLGTTSIGKIGDSYSQNVKTLEDYYQRLDQGQLPILRGVALTFDDKVRRAVITELMCHFILELAAIERDYNINFKEYFATEWQALAPLEADGLLRRHKHNIEVLPAGRLLVRTVAMTFDRYLRESQQQRFSKVI